MPPQLDKHKCTKVEHDIVLQMILTLFQLVFLFHSRDETYTVTEFPVVSKKSGCFTKNTVTKSVESICLRAVKDDFI